MDALDDPTSFIWASGIENTFVPQTRPGHRALDEYELMGHYKHWRDDLALARALQLQALRWGVPWYRVEPQQGQFDWHWTDQVIPYLVHELGITPIIDLMHYGCPLWMQKPFVDPNYPRAVAAYAGAFAERYHDLIRWYTPLNEPLMNASMCGKRGLWPPYARGDRGYVRLTLQLAKGMLATVAAIKAADHEARIVHVDVAGVVNAAQPALAAIAHEDQARIFLNYDLLTGKVVPDHPLWAWLVRNGASVLELRAIAEQAITIDIMGVNFYPQWSTMEAYVKDNGQLAYRRADKTGAGFAALLRTYYERYRVPLMVTETSAFGTLRQREAWLGTSVAAVKQVRSEGVPVIGYTWFPLFTMIDWRYRHGRGPAEQYRVELGLYALGNGDEPRWRATPLVDQFRSYVANTVDAVGELAAAPSVV